MRHLSSLALVLVAPVVLAPLLVPASASPEEVRIALLDSGILLTHPEFAPGQVVAWKDFVNGQPAPYDDEGHGTAVASRAAGATMGAYPGAKLIVGKVLDSGGFAWWANVANGIRWATEQGADVISVSIWSPSLFPTSNLVVANAINDASARGVLVVWIAGNGGTGSVQGAAVPAELPATVLPGGSSPQALVVGAAYEDGRKVWYSRMDPEILAPGCDVTLALIGNASTSRQGCGTSYAAPWVAGVAARMIAEGAPRDLSWLKWVLCHVARDSLAVTYLDEGYGFVGAAEAAQAYAIARGDAPVPGPDARDGFHAGTAAARVVASGGKMPNGTLPP